MAKNSIEEMNSGRQGLADLLAAQFGDNGFRLGDSSSSLDADERYYFVQALQDCVFSATINRGGDNISNLTLSAGLYIVGVFSDVVVTSGVLKAYIL